MALDIARNRGKGLDVTEPPIKALSAAVSTYPRGYHKGDVGGLAAIDADLAVGNIKSGITVFGVAGSANVRDISDANAVASDVLTAYTFYAASGGKRTGTMPVRTLSPDNETVNLGYYSATTLSAVDTDLAAANIKSGITIFGFTGPATVQDIADADAVLADVKNGKTFYSVTGARKTGNIPTVALAPGSSAYPAGYHAGDGGGLPAIDADLVTANIKNGITIFNVAGHTDVRNVSDADAVLADVKNGKTFYAVGGARKTGNLATVAITAANDNYPAGYHAGNAGGLDAIDADLAPGNIKDGVTIFGKLGTFSQTLSEDALDTGVTADNGDSGGTRYSFQMNVPTATDYLVASVTDTYDADSMAVAVGSIHGFDASAIGLHLRLVMDGVNVATGAAVGAVCVFHMIIGTRALSGSKTCSLKLYNSWGVAAAPFTCGYSANSGEDLPAGIGVGSIKKS